MNKDKTNPTKLHRQQGWAAVCALLHLLALPALAQPTKQGDIANNFTVVNHDGSGAINLYDFAGQVVVLDFWAYWCGPCQTSSPDLEVNVADYFKNRNGNDNGVPVTVLPINIESQNPAATDAFIASFGLSLVADDFTQVAYNQFSEGFIPLFVIINGVANSPTHQQWEVLYLSSGYPGATAIRAIVNSVQPPSGPSIVSEPLDVTAIAGSSAAFSVTATTQNGPLRYQWRHGGNPLAGETNRSLTISNIQTSDAGAYDVVVTDSIGNVTSRLVALLVATPPSFLQQPVGGTFNAGESITLSVVAGGSGPYSYQWRKDGVNLPGRNTQTMTLNPLGISDAGAYTVFLSTPSGSIVSSAAQLVVNPLPTTISWNPGPITYGQSLGASHLNATANVPGSFTYPQNGVVLSAGPQTLQAQFSPADTNTYRIENLSVPVVITPAPLIVQADNVIRPFNVTNPPLSISYLGFVNGEDTNVLTSLATATTTVTISSPLGNYPINVSGAAASNYAITHVAGIFSVVSDLPVISAQPQDLLVDPGHDASFTVIASGAPPLFYQWRLNGQPVPDGTNTTLNITQVSAAHLGGYDCVVSNASGTVTSHEVVLSMTGPPIIVTQPTLVHTAAGGTLAVEVRLAGTRPFTHHWYRFADRIHEATDSTLVIDPVQVSDAGMYQLVVFNNFGNAATALIDVRVQHAPTISVPVSVARRRAGESFAVTATVGGDGPPHLQWLKDGQSLAGETNTLLSIPQVTRQHSGVYRALVTNLVGQAFSRDIHLDVDIPPRMQAPVRQQDGKFRVVIGASDGLGSLLTQRSNYVILGISSLGSQNWQVLSTNGSNITENNGQLEFQDQGAAGEDRRFYLIYQK